MKGSQGGNLKAASEAETMEGCFPASFPWFAHPAFKNPHPEAVLSLTVWVLPL